MKPIIYVAAPVSGAPFDNAQRAIRWVRWFCDEDPSRIYIAPWVAEVMGYIGEDVSPAFYQRVLDDDCEVVGRACQGLVGVGGKWSIGMLQERATAKAMNHPVLNMTAYLEPEDVPPGFSLRREWDREIRDDEWRS